METVYIVLIIFLMVYLCKNTEHLNLGGIAPIQDKCRTYNALKDKYYSLDHMNRKKYLWWDGKYDNDRKSTLFTSMGGHPRFLPRNKYCRMFKKDPECNPLF